MCKIQYLKNKKYKFWLLSYDFIMQKEKNKWEISLWAALKNTSFLTRPQIVKR